MLSTAAFRHYPSQSHMGAALGAQLEQLAFSYGRYYDSYLVTEAKFEYLWTSTHSGCIAFVRQGRTLFTVGGIIAPDSEKGAVLAALAAFGAANNVVVAAFTMDEADLPVFRANGWQATKFGEDAVVDLTDQTFTGSQFSWLRRQSSYCRRNHLFGAELRRGGTNEQTWNSIAQELWEISSEHLGRRPQRAKPRPFEGWFDPLSLGRRRVFVARRDNAESGAVEAFIGCTPMENGRSWGIETYRYRKDATRGVIPFLMLTALNTFKAEGIERVSLCLIPAGNAAQPTPGDNAMIRWLLTAAAKFGGRFYDVHGLWHFKSRFRPRFESRYVCILGRATPGTLWDFIVVAGCLDLRFLPSIKRSLSDHRRLLMPSQ